MTSPREAIDNITPDARFFSKFDAKSGYWQMELDKNSQDLTTFLTPWGRYKSFVIVIVVVSFKLT